MSEVGGRIFPQTQEKVLSELRRSVGWCVQQEGNVDHLTGQQLGRRSLKFVELSEEITQAVCFTGEPFQDVLLKGLLVRAGDVAQPGVRLYTF